MMKYTEILEEIYQEVLPLIGQGKLADYIPELAHANPNHFGVSLCKNNGDEFTLGDADTYFTIQSISKVFTFVLAYKLLGDKLWNRLGREPSGNRFDSLVLLENENGVPRNPFINAGALVITDILISHYKDPIKEVIKFVQTLSGNPNIEINHKVRDSEISCSNRNYALTYFMKSFGNIKNNVDDIIHIYSAICSINMTCMDLARSFRLFSSNGLNPWDQQRILTTSQTKRINAVMMTCGLYNAVGDFAYRVGIPAKSGVSGGIVGIIPNEMSIAVWSPGLDQNGNSLAGSMALELFTTKAGISIY